jgi:hypothetical protein
MQSDYSNRTNAGYIVEKYIIYLYQITGTGRKARPYFGFKSSLELVLYLFASFRL